MIDRRILGREPHYVWYPIAGMSSITWNEDITPRLVDPAFCKNGDSKKRSTGGYQTSEAVLIHGP